MERRPVSPLPVRAGGVRFGAILRAKREWESTVDSLPDAILVLDRTGRVVRANAAVARYGLGSLIWLLHRGVREVLASASCCDGFDLHWREWWSAGGDGERSWVEERPDGRQWRLRLRRAADPVNRNGSRPSRAVLILSEIHPHGEEPMPARIFDALEEERRRMSIELHDGIGQILTAVTMAIEGYRRRCGGEDDRLLALAVDKAREAMEEARRIAMALRPSVLDDLGLVPAVDWLCRELRTLYPSSVVTQRVELDEAAIDPHLKVVVYRLLQEALNNAAKHACASHIDVSLWQRDGSLVLQVSDNGRGMSVEHGSGIGLEGMHDRVRRSGGRLSIESKPGRGTVVRATWPHG